jgi:hypothetical protein
MFALLGLERFDVERNGDSVEAVIGSGRRGRRLRRSGRLRGCGRGLHDGSSKTRQPLGFLGPSPIHRGPLRIDPLCLEALCFSSRLLGGGPLGLSVRLGRVRQRGT